MIKDLIFGKTQIPWLTQGMTALARRQQAVADNLANSQTPGYRRQVVDFEEDLRREFRKADLRGNLIRTDPRHLSGGMDLHRVESRVREADPQRDGPGSETVVVEQEMSDLAQSQISFEAQVKLAQTQFEMLKMAIKGMR
jgi:flagellar basal-body rod protein FlgB